MHFVPRVIFREGDGVRWKDQVEAREGATVNMAVILGAMQTYGPGPFKVVTVNPIRSEDPESWDIERYPQELIVCDLRTGAVFEDVSFSGEVFVKLSPLVN